MFTQARLIGGGLVLLALVSSYIGLYVWGSGWKHQYTDLQSKDLAATVARQKVVIADLQDQIKTRDATLAHNKQVMSDLSNKHIEDTANLGATGELVNRLLRDAAKTRSSTGAVPKAGSGPAAGTATIDSGDERLGGLLVRVAAEYWQHVADCTALQAEVIPQL